MRVLYRRVNKHGSIPNFEFFKSEDTLTLQWFFFLSRCADVLYISPTPTGKNLYLVDWYGRYYTGRIRKHIHPWGLRPKYNENTIWLYPNGNITRVRENGEIKEWQIPWADAKARFELYRKSSDLLWIKNQTWRLNYV